MSDTINDALAKLREGIDRVRDADDEVRVVSDAYDLIDAIPPNARLRIEQPGEVWIRITRDDLDPDAPDCLLNAAAYRIGEEAYEAFEAQT